MADARLYACINRVLLAEKQMMETRAVLEQIIMETDLTFSAKCLKDGTFNPSARWEIAKCLEDSAFNPRARWPQDLPKNPLESETADTEGLLNANGSCSPEGQSAISLKVATIEDSSTAQPVASVPDQKADSVQSVEKVTVPAAAKALLVEPNPVSTEAEAGPTSIEGLMKLEKDSKVTEITNKVLQPNPNPRIDAADLLGTVDEIAVCLGIEVEEVKRAFKHFCQADGDGSGKVSTLELKGLLESVGGRTVDQTSVDRLLQVFDKNNDGELDFEEFLFCFCKTPAKRQGALTASLMRDEDRLDTHIRTQVVGVRADIVKKFLQKELDEEEAFLAIPVIFLLFFFFLLSVILHMRTTVTGSIESAIKTDILNNANFALAGIAPFENARTGFHSIFDIGSFHDFWSWVDLGLVPLFFPSGWSLSESRSNIAARCVDPLSAMGNYGWRTVFGNRTMQSNTPYGNGAHAPGAGDLGPNLCNLDEQSVFPEPLSGLKEYANPRKAPYLMFYEIVGGMRLRQEQMPEVECEASESYASAFATPCIEVNDFAWLMPDLGTALTINNDYVNMPGGETAYFKSGMTLSEVRRGIRDLEDKRWLNQRTSKVEISYTTYNNHLNIFVVLFINFFFSRAGHIHKIIKPVSIWMNPYSDPTCYVVDFLFLTMVLKLFFEEGREVARLTKEEGKRGLQSYFTNFHNALDWIAIVYSVVIFIMWGIWCTNVANLGDLLASSDATIKGSWVGGDDLFTPANAEYWDTVDFIASYQQTFKNVLAIYPFIIGMRFFGAFGSQPRLGLVTTTLKCAANDLIHFGVVLAVTIMIFCVSGEILFGRDVDEFENFGRTYVTVFRALLGDFDHMALVESGRLPASLWMGLFMVSVNMVMLNMLLAIIMDIYGSVKNSMSNDEDNFPTLWSQSYEIWRRWRQKQKGQRLSLHHILLALDACDEQLFSEERNGAKHTPKLITVYMFLGMVPNLEKKQAERLLANAEAYRDAMAGPQNDMMDCLKRLRAVDLRVQAISESLMKDTEILLHDLHEVEHELAENHAFSEKHIIAEVHDLAGK